MAKTSANYEVMYIIDLDKGEEGIAAIVEKFKTLIETNGTLTELEEMGKRRLAYLVNDKAEGYYVLAKFTSAPSFPAELDRILKITDGVMRSLITVVAE
jgi:small subunit ribosomal protein S6